MREQGKQNDQWLTATLLDVFQSLYGEGVVSERRQRERRYRTSGLCDQREGRKRQNMLCIQMREEDRRRQNSKKLSTSVGQRNRVEIDAA